MTETLVGDNVQICLAKSLKVLSRMIGSSLGPDGRAVFFGGDNQVEVAVSGVEIARKASDTQGASSVAPRLLTETLVSAERDLGDGTARLAILACETFTAAQRFATDPLRRLALAERLDGIREDIAEMLEEEQRAGVPDEEIAGAAGVDEDLSSVLASAFRQVGIDGGIDIVVEAGGGVELNVEKGFTFEAVAAGGANGPRIETSLDDVHILAANEAISDFGKLVPVIDGFAARRKSLLIVARQFEGSALAAIERNRREGAVSIVALSPADAGPRAAAVIGDLAVACGAALVDEFAGTTLESLKPDMLGTAKLLRFDRQRVFLEKPGGAIPAIDARLAEISREIEKAKYLSFDREYAERRRARLQGRWAELRIGGVGHHEAKRVEAVSRNAIACMRSASRHGVVEGGGVVLREIADRLVADAQPGESGDAKRVAGHALRSIETQLQRNSAMSFDISPVWAPVANRASIMDPLRLTQQLVSQALSLASSLLRVEAIVCR